MGLCWRCKTRNVPADGRAARNGLCCKCDRELNGQQNESEKSDKQIVRERKQQIKNENKK